MPFRFNQKDLSILATQPSDQYAKEGLLWFKEREGKLFNKTDTFTERLIRLRGNLLFYFKGKDKSTECSGVIVLERFIVSPDSSYKRNGFAITFNVPDERRYEFAANSKNEYDEWMELIKKASFERLQQRLIELRTRITTITGQDPLPDYHPLISAEQDCHNKSDRGSMFVPEAHGQEEEVLMEMCIACTNLMPDSDVAPSAMIKVFTVEPPETEWTKHSQTEISEESREPSFLRTIIFSTAFRPVTRLKFGVYNVINKSKNDVSAIGQAYCTLQEIQQAANWQLTLSIMNVDVAVGSIVIQGWQRESRRSFDGRCMSFTLPDGQSSGGMVTPPRTFITNPIQRSFHFPTRDGNDLKFQSCLAESTLCFKIPRQLLSLFIAEEKEGVIELHNIGQLHPDWERVKQVVQNSHFDIVHQYSTNYADLCQNDEDNFKKSIDKAKKDLEFIPTNMHVERLCVIEADKQEYIYDIVTVGAPTAFPQKYKHGGLKRLFSNNDEMTRKIMQGTTGPEEKRKSVHIKAKQVKVALKELQKDISQIFVEIQEGLENNDKDIIHNTCTKLTMKVGDLLGLHSTDFVQGCNSTLRKARTNGPELRIKSVIISNDIDSQVYKNLAWDWTGTEYKAVTSTTTESDCGVRDALAQFTSKINAFSGAYENIDDLLNDANGLESSLTSLIRKIHVIMRFTLMQDEAECPSLKDLRYRKDIVLSQTLTPMVCGFAVMLSQRIHDEVFLKQISKLGLLIYFESLLTTYGDETGMIEDMYIGMKSLSCVHFKIVRSDSDDPPLVSGTRSEILVTFSLKASLFKLLPSSLQNGGLISLHPVLFLIGINEQATLAERFGDTSLQEYINLEGLEFLEKYQKRFSELFPDHVGTRNQNPVPLNGLLDHLRTTVNTKKSKNYEVLLIAEELCTRLNSLRLTSCKSGKDRSSMAVTLEIVKILEREHNMEEKVFQQVLDSVRSQGTRLLNCYKNVGLAKYAFNKVQVKALPSVYRPPEGTIGKYLQT